MEVGKDMWKIDKGLKSMKLMEVGLEIT